MCFSVSSQIVDENNENLQHGSEIELVHASHFGIRESHTKLESLSFYRYPVLRRIRSYGIMSVSQRCTFVIDLRRNYWTCH